MAAAILNAAIGNLAIAAALAIAAFVAGRRAKWQAVAHGAWFLVLLKLVTPPLFAFPASRGVDHWQSVDNAFPWATLLLGAWLAGSCAWVAVAALRIRQFARLLRFAAPAPAGLADDVAEAGRRIGLARSPRVKVLPGGVAPLVWAIGRTTVYLPADLLARVSPEQRLTLIAHELAHLRRGDYIVRWIESAALAVWWWCPLAWLARRELRRLEEEACDAEVAIAFPGSGHAYASAIVETIDMLAATNAMPALASGLGDAAGLRRRLILVLDNQPAQRPAKATKATLAVAGLALLAIGPNPNGFGSDAPVRACVQQPRWHAESVPVPCASEPRPKVEVTLPAPIASDAEPMQFRPTPVRLNVPEANGSGACLAAALSPDGTQLALADGSSVTVCDPATGRTLFALTGVGGAVNAIAYSPDGTRIATAGQDGLAKLWDAATGRELHTLIGHDIWVSAVAFSPDGRTLATGGYDKTVRIWDVATGALKATWTGHTGGVRALAFAPDGRTLASGGADHEVRLWDVASSKTIRVFQRHQGSVRTLAFAPDGGCIASGSDDGTVRLWCPTDGQEFCPSIVLPDFVTALAFLPCGRTLFAGTFGGHLLDIDPIAARPRAFVGVSPGEPANLPAHADAVTAVLTSCGVPITVSHDRAVLAWSQVAPPSDKSPRSFGDWAAKLWNTP